MRQRKMTTESKKELSRKNQEEQFQKDRRDFLGKSKYAVYMTPVMFSMVVDDAAAASSSANCNSPQTPPCP